LLKDGRERLRTPGTAARQGTGARGMHGEKPTMTLTMTELPDQKAMRYHLDTTLGQQTRADRADRGKAIRASVPRDSHAAFERQSGQDPLALLEQQELTRLPELVPVRHGRMMTSPFSYFRGAALPMASDLAGTPVTGLSVQACGDAHLSNFGLFGTGERNLVFDINDFDETMPGPWEWDIKRLAASMEIAARDNGLPTKKRRQIVLATVASYRRAMREFAGQTSLEVWYSRVDVDRLQAQVGSLLNARQRRGIGKAALKARGRDSREAAAKLTDAADGRRRIVGDPPLIVPADQLLQDRDHAALESLLTELIGRYQRTLDFDRAYLLDQYHFADMALKVVGVGSVGTRCWVVLMLGSDDSDPLLLQVKEAEASVLSHFVGASAVPTAGQRVVAGQRLMQAASDIFLGWERSESVLDGQQRDFYVRQLRDWKFSFDIGALLPRGLRVYGEVCGWTLARAHARSGDRIGIAAYLGPADVFDQAVAEFAASYADQNQRDYDALTAAVASGRMVATTGL
jgi:uncharacterized protein (DUF2252 family)